MSLRNGAAGEAIQLNRINEGKVVFVHTVDVITGSPQSYGFRDDAEKAGAATIKYTILARRRSR